MHTHVVVVVCVCGKVLSQTLRNELTAAICFASTIGNGERKKGVIRAYGFYPRFMSYRLLARLERIS